MANNRNAVKRKRKAVRHSGQFRKGNDPRRNIKGQRNSGAVAFSKTLRSLLVSEGEKLKKGTDDEGKHVTIKKVVWLSKIVWQKALIGEPWAVQFIAERVEGKITQPLEHSGKIDSKLIIEVVKTK